MCQNRTSRPGEVTNVNSKDLRELVNNVHVPLGLASCDNSDAIVSRGSFVVIGAEFVVGMPGLYLLEVMDIVSTQAVKEKTVSRRFRHVRHFQAKLGSPNKIRGNLYFKRESSGTFDIWTLQEFSTWPIDSVFAILNPACFEDASPLTITLMREYRTPLMNILRNLGESGLQSWGKEELKKEVIAKKDVVEDLDFNSSGSEDEDDGGEIEAEDEEEVEEEIAIEVTSSKRKRSQMKGQIKEI